jgi:hypothetical protein
MFISDFLTPAWAAGFFGHSGPLSPAAKEYWTQGVQFFGNVVVGTAWFLGTKLFWRQTAPIYKANIETFFTQLNTPVNFAREEGAHTANDDRQSQAIGWLCLAYGAFVVLLAAIPNPLSGRLAFVGCGSLVLLVAWLLLRRPRLAPGRATDSTAHSGHVPPR